MLKKTERNTLVIVSVNGIIPHVHLMRKFVGQYLADFFFLYWCQLAFFAKLAPTFFLLEVCSALLLKCSGYSFNHLQGNA